ncbi:MAG: amidohydrolase [Candidatus Delongbacteria bacterium]|nr:amidohydrolase [Candidatus Delongbacteria bacterium]MBN2836087.1 amidohydrolase [Candidatus Delongbacteria bacterium]
MDYSEVIVNHRRYLHTIPEIGFQEYKTSGYIYNKLVSLNCFQIKKYAGTGIVASYKVNNDKFTAFRSDIDALPVTELTDLDFSSEHNGFMHACGHDFHMAILLTFAEFIKDTKPQKNILLIFQPAEEGPAGGKKMVEEGLFNDFPTNEVFALHTSPKYRTGSIGVNHSKMFAGTVEFHLKLKGRGGHAAYPHRVDDVNTAGASLILQLNTITSRFLDPIHENVLSIGYIQGGKIANVIPEEFIIHGTARSYNRDDISVIKRKLMDMTEGVAKSYGLEFEVDFVSEYVPVINSKESADKIIESARKSMFDVVDCPPEMTGEDFGFMNSLVGGAIFWLGVGYNDESKNYNLHNPKYSPDENALKIGFEILKGLI